MLRSTESFLLYPFVIHTITDPSLTLSISDSPLSALLLIPVPMVLFNSHSGLVLITDEPQLMPLLISNMNQCRSGSSGKSGFPFMFCCSVFVDTETSSYSQPGRAGMEMGLRNRFQPWRH